MHVRMAGFVWAIKSPHLISLQRYLTRDLLHSLFSVRQKGAVVALLDAGYQLENVRNRQGLQGQDHR